MAKLYDSKPLQQSPGRKALAVAFALVMAAAWQPAPATAQIEVDVLTTAPESAQPTPASGQDRSAEEAAQKILPAPGTEMQSTEDSSLETGEAVAEKPSVQLTGDGAIINAGETTETVAVRSGAELLKMLGLRKSQLPQEGLELDEETTNPLFDVDAIRRLKGDEPTVVYRVVIEQTPLPDPMIVPWIRQAKLLQERFERAVLYLGENRLDEGREELLAIISDFPESDHAAQAQAILAKLDDLNRADIPRPTIRDTESVAVRLSPNVHVGTVIVDPANAEGNRAMIAGRAYKVGDEIRGEPGHVVVGISENVVQVEVEQSGVKEIFDLPVRPNRLDD